MTITMTSLEDFFADLAATFIGGDLRGVLGKFDLPVAVYANDKVLVFSNEDRLLEAMTQYHHALTSAGIRTIDVRVAAIPLLRGRTGTIWVDAIYRDETGGIVDTGQIRYFFRIHHGRPLVCMMEYLSCPAAAALLTLDIFHAA